MAFGLETGDGPWERISRQDQRGSGGAIDMTADGERFIGWSQRVREDLLGSVARPSGWS